MKPIVYNGNYIVNEQQMDFENPVEIHFTRFGNNQRPLNGKSFDIKFSENTFKVFCNFNEPTTSENTETTEDVINHSEHYDLILTSRDEIIDACDNAVFFPYGSTWLYKDLNHPDGIGYYHPSIDSLHKDKTDTISFLITKHRGKEGYDIRHEIWNAKDQINNKLFYSSTRNPVSFAELLPNDDKKELFKSKFSIVIESTKEENYFTEKICDALLSKTIPIYWGCPNIDDFFNTKGMIVCHSAEEIIAACKNIDFDFYEKKKRYVNQNFKSAKKYCESLTKRISDEIRLNDKRKNVETNNTQKPNNIVLSVGILTLTNRDHFFQRLMNHLYNIVGQWAKSIEFVVAKDNKQKTVGEKRNEVLDKANGKYVCFIDDDDLVDQNYFNWIMQVLLEHPDADAIGFNGLYYVSGNPVLRFSHSSSHNGHRRAENEKGETIQLRPINHLNPVRTEIAREIRFPEKSFGEDSDYCDRLFASNKLKKEVFVDQTLYHYLYDPTSSATQSGNGVNI